MSVKGSSTIWNDQTLTILRQLYPTTPANDIAEVIGCSDCTVLNKAKELGLQRDKSFHRNNFIGRYVGRGRYKIANYDRK